MPISRRNLLASLAALAAIPGRASTSSVFVIAAGLSAARDQARQIARRGDAGMRAMAHALLKIMFDSDFPARQRPGSQADLARQPSAKTHQRRAGRALLRPDQMVASG